MRDDLYSAAKKAFLQVLGLPESERAAFLELLTYENEPLFLEVQALMEHADAENSMDVTPSRADTVFKPSVDSPSEEIDNYVLLQRLGQGGMGEVWEADQIEPIRRRVALTLIKWGMDSREVVARFETERQALALMSHPNIAKVFDAGSTSRGRPYFVMELVKGVPIDDYCDRERLSTQQRLELFVEVCRGVQHAHQKGVIHRDMKPSNVLVSIQDGKPVPKIIDFGVAKATGQRLTEQTLFTQLGQWIGTPEYMSPEQAEMTGLGIDTRTDVYSLGVLMYELLVGSLPFSSEGLRRAGFDEMRRRICEDEPTRPSTKITTMGDASEAAARNRRTDPVSLARELRGDLDWIALKCIEKDRTRRYESPSELAADIERFLHHEPVLASPPGAIYLATKFFRRHRLGTVATLLVLLAVALGIAGTSIGMIRARREAEIARLVADEMVGLFGAMDPSGISVSTSMQGLLDRGAERVEGRLAGHPLVQARLGAAIGKVYLNLGDYEQAAFLLEQALERYRLHGEAADPDAALALNFKGWLLFLTGDYKAAMAAHQEALDIRVEVFGEKHRSVVHSLLSLGHAAWKSSAYEDALASLGRGERLARSVLGEEHWLLAVALHHQAVVRLDTSELDEARRLLEEALAIAEKNFDVGHMQVTWIVLDLGRTLQLAGDSEAARPYLERALASYEALFGPDHPGVAYPLAWLAEIIGSDGEPDEAESMFKRSLTIWETALGPEHPDLSMALRPYGFLLLRQGDVQGARELLERSVEINRNAYPSDHIAHSRDLSSLAFLESRLGNYAAAEPLTEQALAVRVRLLGSDSSSLGGLLYNLSCLSALQGDRREALARLRRAVDLGFRSRLMPEDSDLDSLRGNREFEAIQDEVRRAIGAD